MDFPNEYNYNSKTHVSSGGATEAIVNKMESYGNYVTIEVDYDNSLIIYAHQQQNSFVKADDPVKAGQQIGIVGNTGVSTNNHLHFEIRDKKTAGNTVFDYFRWDY